MCYAAINSYATYSLYRTNTGNSSTSTTDLGTMYYVHTDHLGSYNLIMDADKNIVDSLHFDPWGNRKRYNNWASNDTRVSFLFDRGFTGHEHLDRFKIINMNGRLYDPVLTRFFSPDPYVQFPDFTQNFNRYSYCLNNPLMYVDPSGEFLWAIVTTMVRAGFDLLTNNWQGWEGSGKPALKAGFWGLLSPAGATTTGVDILKFVASEVGNRILSNYASVNLQAGNFSFSFSPGLGHNSISGFSWNINANATYSSEDWEASKWISLSAFWTSEFL